MDKKINLSEVLKQKLQEGEVSFAYRKKSGELRIAKGTTKLDGIPEEARPKGTGSLKENCHAYWDLNVSGWRAYNPLCVVWVEYVGNDNLTKEEYDQIMLYAINNA